MSGLQNQVVLVTGCSTGIGRALAVELAELGHRPFATARKLESIADLAQKGIETLRLDVDEPATITEAVETAIARAGHIDVLVNNAGVNVFGPLLELPLAELRRVFETNVLGLIAATQAVFPHMAARRAGRIVNVGSVAGLLPTPFAAAYCSSKSAVHMLSDVMRMELAPFGIDVIVVQPGRVKSSIADTGSRDIERFQAEGSRYRAAYSGIYKRAYASQEDPTPTETFARELIAEALKTPAPRVIRQGAGADQIAALAEMPGDQRDALLSAHFDLSALRA